MINYIIGGIAILIVAFAVIRKVHAVKTKKPSCSYCSGCNKSCH